LTTPRAFETTAAGVHVHRSSLLSEGDVTTRSLIRCTTFERTLCDLTTQLSWLQLGRVLDDGLRSGDTTVKKLYDVVARLDSGPYRRLTVVQGLLAQRDADYDPGGSNAERRLVELVTNAGFPPPVQQYQVRVGGRRYFLDLAWPEHRVFVEWYGLPWHVGASRVAYDNARVSELSAVGWRPLIFTDESSQDDIIRQVRDLLDLVRSEQQRRGA
jgi:very-short-patch-repair endonuclease